MDEPKEKQEMDKSKWDKWVSKVDEFYFTDPDEDDGDNVDSEVEELPHDG